MNHIKKLRWLGDFLAADADSKGIGQGSEGARYCFAGADAIEELQAENAALKEQVAQLQTIISEEAKDSGNVILELDQAKKTISEQQAHIKKLRMLVESANKGVAGAHSVMWQKKAREALAIESSTEALREHDAQLIGKIRDIVRAAYPTEETSAGLALMLEAELEGMLDRLA